METIKIINSTLPVSDNFSFLERRLNDHSKRILVLDNWRWYTMGGFALFIIIITFILQLSRL
jgi:hypothetical protein